MAEKIFSDDKWVVAKIESFDEAKKYASATKWGIAQEQKFWDSHSKDGDIFFIKNKADKTIYAYQPKTNLLADQNDQVIKIDDFFAKNPDVKQAFNSNKTDLNPTKTTDETPEAVAGEVAKPATNESLDLNDLYKSMLAEKNTTKYDITSSTHKVLSKSPPRGKFVTGLEQEFFGIDPELMQQLPMKSVQLFQQALIHLVSATQENPMLRQALRQMIKNQIKVAEQEVDEGEVPPELTKESIITSFKETMKQITEAKIARFNYKVFLDIDPSKINDVQFVSLLNSFDLLALSRMQKQGVLLLFKKLAEIAEQNPMIAQALNRIVKLEATKEIPQESMRESISFTLDDFLLIEEIILSEAIAIPVPKSEARSFVSWFNSELSSDLSKEEIKTIYPTGFITLNSETDTSITQIQNILKAFKMVASKNKSKADELFNTIKTKYKTVFDNMKAQRK